MTTSLNMESGLDLHAKVSVRPERFGALLYHFGTRRLSFLKDPRLLEVIRALPGLSARQACVHAGVPETDLPRYERALERLVETDMLVVRGNPTRQLEDR